MIAMAWKHENVFIGVDAYAPKHMAEGAGALPELATAREKVLFGTDWPVIDPERAVKEMAEHKFKPAAYDKIMRGNALKVFKL